MGNILNRDFTDFILALNEASVKYILVGGYAVIYHGYNRTTGDLDIWVETSSENYLRIRKAFALFGLSLFDMTEEKFNDPMHTDVFTFGRPPVCIEILTRVSGLEFEFAYNNSVTINWEGLNVRIIDIRDLKTNKKTSGRFKDLDDLQNLGI